MLFKLLIVLQKIDCVLKVKHFNISCFCYFIQAKLNLDYLLDNDFFAVPFLSKHLCKCFLCHFSFHSSILIQIIWSICASSMSKSSLSSEKLMVSASSSIKSFVKNHHDRSKILMILLDLEIHLTTPVTPVFCICNLLQERGYLGLKNMQLDKTISFHLHVHIQLCSIL